MRLTRTLLYFCTKRVTLGVLGSFDSRAEAEAKGAELLGAGTVKESRVVPLKRR